MEKAHELVPENPHQNAIAFPEHSQFLVKISCLREKGVTEVKAPNLRGSGTAIILLDRLEDTERKVTELVEDPHYEGYVSNYLFLMLYNMRALRLCMTEAEIDRERAKLEGFVQKEIPPFLDDHLYLRECTRQGKKVLMGSFPLKEFIIQFGGESFFHDRGDRSKAYKRGNVVKSILRSTSSEDVERFCQRWVAEDEVDPAFQTHVTLELCRMLGEEEAEYALQQAHGVFNFLAKIFRSMSPKEKIYYHTVDRSKFSVPEFWEEHTSAFWYRHYSPSDRGFVHERTCEWLAQQRSNAYTRSIALRCRPLVPTIHEVVEGQRDQIAKVVLLAVQNTLPKNGIKGIATHQLRYPNVLQLVESHIKAHIADFVQPDEGKETLLFDNQETILRSLGMATAPQDKLARLIRECIREVQLRLLNGMSREDIVALYVQKHKRPGGINQRRLGADGVVAAKLRAILGDANQRRSLVQEDDRDLKST